MAKLLKSTETRYELSTTCNPMSRCLSAPAATSYIAASRTIVNIKLNSGIGQSEASLERGFLRYMPSPFYTASVVLFQLHGVICKYKLHSHNLCKILNTWILTTETILVLDACS